MATYEETVQSILDNASAAAATATAEDLVLLAKAAQAVDIGSGVVVSGLTIIKTAKEGALADIATAKDGAITQIVNTSANNVLSTCLDIENAYNAGSAVQLNNFFRNAEHADFVIGTVETDFIISAGSVASGFTSYIDKSSNLYILNFAYTGQYGYYYTSTDGVTWTKRTSPYGSSDASQTYYASVSANSAYWVAYKNNSTSGYWTTDGVNWTAITFSSATYGGYCGNGVFSYNGSLYISSFATPTSFHKFTSAYVGEVALTNSLRTGNNHTIVAVDGLGVMFSKDAHGEAGYTFTSDLTTFISYTFPFEAYLGSVPERLYSTETNKLIFKSYGTNEAYTTTNMTSFTRDTYSRYNIGSTFAQITKYQNNNKVPSLSFTSYVSSQTEYSGSGSVYTVSSVKDYIKTSGNALIVNTGIRHNHTTNKTEVVLLGKKFDWYTDNVKFPVQAYTL